MEKEKKKVKLMIASIKYYQQWNTQCTDNSSSSNLNLFPLSVSIKLCHINEFLNLTTQTQTSFLFSFCFFVRQRQFILPRKFCVTKNKQSNSRQRLTYIGQKFHRIDIWFTANILVQNQYTQNVRKLPATIKLKQQIWKVMKGNTYQYLIYAR